MANKGEPYIIKSHIGDNIKLIIIVYNNTVPATLANVIGLRCNNKPNKKPTTKALIVKPIK